MPNAEIEIQVRVERSDDLRTFLDTEATFEYEHHQTDEYFNPPHKDFTKTRPIDDWLRLRDADGAFTINFKHWNRQNGESTYADESETAIESIDTMRDILQAVDFRPLITVNKVRRTYHYQDYEISLDSVEGLGDFVEMEYQGERDSSESPALREEMIAFLKTHNIGKLQQNNLGYPFMLLFPDEITFKER